MHENDQPSAWGRIPGFAKILLALQTFAILFLSFWIFQEYQNNKYLQAYLNTSLQGTGFTLIAILTVTGFGIAAILLFRKMREVQQELDEILSTESVRNAATHSRNYLDHKTEQHLMSMIRRTQPAETTTQTSLTPTLKQLDSIE